MISIDGSIKQNIKQNMTVKAASDLAVSSGKPQIIKAVVLNNSVLMNLNASTVTKNSSGLGQTPQNPVANYQQASVNPAPKNLTQQNNFGVGLGNGRTYNGSIRYNF